MRKLLFSLLVLLPLSLVAAQLPPYAAFPPGYNSDPAYEVVEDFGKEEFPQPNDQPSKIIEGKHYQFGMRAEPGLDEVATWKQLRPVFLARGWKPVAESGTKVLHLQTPGREAWIRFDIFGSDDVRVSMIEVAAQKETLSLRPPAAQPDAVADDADFPYLGHAPGTTLKETQHDQVPMDVTTEHDQEQQLAGTSSTVKFYTRPANLSVHQFISLYRNALTAAGWTVLYAAEGSDGTILAHYPKNGRDLWTSIHVGEDISVRVADAGNLRAQLDKLCHVPVYGIHFDFNKATLRPDSEGALQQIASLLQSNPSLSVEVQGHTDNVGNDAANQKLSEARAGAVKSWLVQHGVAASRVSARGYGRSKPVASNDNDEGRAKNRRVEVAKVGC